MFICIFCKNCIILIIRRADNIRISVSVPSCHNLSKFRSTFWVATFIFTNHGEMNWGVFYVFNIGVSFGITNLIFIIHNVVSCVFIRNLFLWRIFLIIWFTFNMTSLFNESSISQLSINTFKHTWMTVFLLVDLVTKLYKILMIFVHSICIPTVLAFLFSLRDILSIFFMIFFLLFITFLILTPILWIWNDLLKKFRKIKFSFWQLIYKIWSYCFSLLLLILKRITSIGLLQIKYS